MLDGSGVGVIDATWADSVVDVGVELISGVGDRVGVGSTVVADEVADDSELNSGVAVGVGVGVTAGAT